MTWYLLIGALGFGMPAEAAYAQDPGPRSEFTQKESTSGSCELRVLTTDSAAVSDGTDFNKDSLPNEGMLVPLVGAGLSALYGRQDPAAIKTFMLSVLGPTTQQALISSKLKQSETLSHYAVSFEAGGTRALDAFKSRKTAPRFSSSTATCLIELSFVVMRYVRTSLYEKTAFLFMLRRFGPAAAPESVVIYAALTPIRKFPPHSDADEKIAASDLTDGFLKTFSKFMEKVATAEAK